jgi:hypothetical protein
MRNNPATVYPVTSLIAQRISDSLMSPPLQDAIAGLQVTELPPEDGAMQWHLCTQLREAGFGETSPAELGAWNSDAEDAFPVTAPAPLLDLAMRGI